MVSGGVRYVHFPDDQTIVYVEKNRDAPECAWVMYDNFIRDVLGFNNLQQVTLPAKIEIFARIKREMESGIRAIEYRGELDNLL